MECDIITERLININYGTTVGLQYLIEENLIKKNSDLSLLILSLSSKIIGQNK